MFFEIFKFELVQWLKKPFAYISFASLALITGLLTAAAGGLMGAINETNTVINSAAIIASILNSVSIELFIPVFLIVAIIAPAVYKDFQYNTHAMFFTKPISKYGYLFGRFTASLLIALLVLSGIIFGHWLVCTFFGVDAALLAPFKLSNYLEPFLFITIPNTIFIGLLFFALATYTRNMIAAYLGCLFLLVAQIIARSLSTELENEQMAALLDPFGQNALNLATKFWTPADSNILPIPIAGILLYNRLLWLGISLLIGAFSFIGFSLNQLTEPFKWPWAKNKTSDNEASTINYQSISEIPAATQDFKLAFNFKQLWYLAKFEFEKIVKTPFFLIIAIISVLLYSISIIELGAIFGTPTQPVTYKMLDNGAGIFGFFSQVLIIFYAGVAIWRERDAKVDELVGASALPSWVLIFSKVLGLLFMIGIMLGIVMLNGIVLQLYMGYTNIELGHYLKDILGFQLPTLLLFILLSVFIHTMLGNRYVAYLIILLITLFLPLGLSQLEISNKLLFFNSGGPSLAYSDMNGYGHRLVSWLPFKAYWLSCCAILTVITSLYWVRGKDSGFKNRWKSAKGNFNPAHRLAMSVAVVAFIALGAYIYYNIAVLNKIRSGEELQVLQANFEKKYSFLKNTPQPKITAVNVLSEIYPDERSMEATGTFKLQNKGTQKVDTVIIALQDGVVATKLSFHTGAKELSYDKEFNFYLFKLDKPMLPGQAGELNFAVNYKPKGFDNDDSRTTIVENGTFFNNSLLPDIGYSENYELGDNKARKKYGLPAKERVPNINDTAAWNTNFLSKSADFIDFEATVGTSADQIGIAPGKLIKTYEKNGRKYFQYKTEVQIFNFYAFLSAKYEVKKDAWKNVAIEIYYHKGHEFNIDKMIAAVKKSLDYYTTQFGSYPHSQVRILEFPRYASFAQSFPNTIPYSESIGFIAKVDSSKEDDVDYPFFVTAHEMGHQWWGDQVLAAQVQGFNVLSESLAEYSALMVMEKNLGQKGIKKFLKYEMNQYLTGRTSEQRSEKPLMLDEGTQYAVYNKGGVVFYALKDYLGEAKLNGVLAKFFGKYARKGPPYPTTKELVDSIKAAAPDSLKYIVTDMLETITLYDNKTLEVKELKKQNGKYLVKIDLSCKKFRADSLGKNKNHPINDWIDVGVFAEQEIKGKKEEKVLYLQKHKIDKRNMSIEIWVNEKPTHAGIDPYHKLIDKNGDNNTKKIGDKAEKDTGSDNDSAGITISL